MAKKSGIELIEEGSGLKTKSEKSNECPVCGAPNGLQKCEKCGWGIEEDMDPLLGTSLDPVSTLRDAKISFISIRREAMELKNKNQLLMANNQKFAELVEVMGNLIGKLRTDSGKRYAYSFGEGGWGESGRDGKSAIKFDKKQVTIEDINKQLMEITHLINKYKK
jgi:hypothetical protein